MAKNNKQNKPTGKNTLSEKEIDEIVQGRDIRKTLHARRTSKWVAIICLICLILTGGTWGVLSFIDYNNVKITINQILDGLSLSEQEDFSNPVGNLTMKGPPSFDAITYSHIQLDEQILKENGDVSRASYIGYSFYLKNVSENKPCTYFTTISLPRVHKNMDSALRIMIIKQVEGSPIESVVYAKAKADNTPEAISYDNDILGIQQPIFDSILANKWNNLITSNITKSFSGIENIDGSDVMVVDMLKDQPLQPQEVVKYTCIIWLEGSDSDCKDDILGGYCTIGVEFCIQDFGSPIELVPSV